jgi:hypothetical protein
MPRATAWQTALETLMLRLVQTRPLLKRINRLHEEIARRAFEFFKNVSWIAGHEVAALCLKSKGVTFPWRSISTVGS